MVSPICWTLFAVVAFKCVESFNFIHKLSSNSEMSRERQTGKVNKRQKDRSEAEYVVDGGVRTVKPYVHAFTTFAKVSSRSYVLFS